MKQRTLLIAGAILVAFSVPRLVLLSRRAPDLDELFTLWLARKPFGAMMATLHQDSGPFLYYEILHVLHLPSVTEIRILSFVFAFATLAMLLRCRRYAAAALLAVYSQHVFFSAEARAYALAA